MKVVYLPLAVLLLVSGMSALFIVSDLRILLPLQLVNFLIVYNVIQFCVFIFGFVSDLFLLIFPFFSFFLFFRFNGQ